MTEAFEKIQKGEDPNEDETKSNLESENEDNGSDSCPSDGNLDLRELYSIIYCDQNKSNLKIQAKKDFEA